jgi:hypothetical protein
MRRRAIADYLAGRGFDVHPALLASKPPSGKLLRQVSPSIRVDPDKGNYLVDTK